jgi:hypothetical protein
VQGNQLKSDCTDQPGRNLWDGWESNWITIRVAGRRILPLATHWLEDVFGKEKNPCRQVFRVASLAFGTPVELELIFEVQA